MKVSNLSRAEAQKYKETSKCVWISFQEPTNEHISNNILDCCPKLKLKFWDLKKPLPTDDGKSFHYPPSKEDAQQIVDFLLTHRGADVICNCAAGVSRSGAISLFCQNILGYEWEYGEQRADPNMYLYNLMVECYNKI